MQLAKFILASLIIAIVGLMVILSIKPLATAVGLGATTPTGVPAFIAGKFGGAPAASA